MINLGVIMEKEVLISLIDLIFRKKLLIENDVGIRIYSIYEARFCLA